MIDDIERSKLEIEAATGEQYQRIMDDIMGDFFTKKQLELFGIFLNMSSKEPDALMLLKMQANAVESLKQEFEHFINTGKMARHTLDEFEENTDGK